MAEITQEIFEEIKQFFETRIGNPPAHKTIMVKKLGVMLNVNIKPITRILTNIVIECIKKNEDRFTKMIECSLYEANNAISNKSAKLTYHCMVYKILEADEFHYETAYGSRLITLNYYCQGNVFNLRRPTLYDRLNNDKFAYCHQDLEHYDIGRVKDVKMRQCMEKLKPVFKMRCH